MKKATLLAIIFILLNIFLFLTADSDLKNILAPKKENTSTRTPTFSQKNKKEKDFSQLLESYRQILAKTQAQFGITFLDLKTGEKISINGEKIFHAASTTKPIVAAYTLKQIEEGKINLDTQIDGLPVSERIRLMINISDNGSWEALLNYFGIPTIQNFSRGLGLSMTDHFNNTSTSDDLAKFLEKIYRGQIFSEVNKAFLLKFMQNTEREDRIPVGIPNKQLVFHKGGTYNGEIHDIAIVEHPENPFTLAILSAGENDLDVRPKILAEIAQTSWEFVDKY